MDERIYNNNGKDKIIKQGEHNGQRYIIATIGGRHPTAYVIVNNEYDMDFIENLGLISHGGFTFSGKLSFEEISDEYLLGWDYAHIGDYTHSKHTWNRCEGHQYTVEEIEIDCRMVIEQLTDINFFDKTTQKKLKTEQEEQGALADIFELYSEENGKFHEIGELYNYIETYFIANEKLYNIWLDLEAPFNGGKKYNIKEVKSTGSFEYKIEEANEYIKFYNAFSNYTPHCKK